MNKFTTEVIRLVVDLATSIIGALVLYGPFLLFGLWATALGYVIIGAMICVVYKIPVYEVRVFLAISLWWLPIALKLVDNNILKRLIGKC
tara:strand:+ start:33 stop:302 length:270 start_codon:yes stop_codon:yes gene_type:complete